MGLMARCLILPICLMLLAGNIRSDDTLPIHIGIEKYRIPYTSLDDQQQAQGLLVQAIQALCKKQGLDCQFSGGTLHELLASLKTIKLNAVLILDYSLPPDVGELKLIHPPNLDDLQLTAPLCLVNPVFIHKNSLADNLKLADFKDKVIGVQQGSVYHKYLLDNYTGIAKFKPYPLLESAVMDLAFDRVDMVIADAAFFKYRVFDTKLDEYFGFKVSRLIGFPSPVNSMVLAVRAKDAELFKQLNTAITTAGSPAQCAELLLTDSVPAKSKD